MDFCWKPSFETDNSLLIFQKHIVCRAVKCSCLNLNSPYLGNSTLVSHPSLKLWHSLLFHLPTIKCQSTGSRYKVVKSVSQYKVSTGKIYFSLQSCSSPTKPLEYEMLEHFSDIKLLQAHNWVCEFSDFQIVKDHQYLSKQSFHSFIITKET